MQLIIVSVHVTEMNERDGCAPMLVVNMDVKDRHEESAIAAPHVLQLCQMVRSSSPVVLRQLACRFEGLAVWNQHSSGGHVCPAMPDTCDPVIWPALSERLISPRQPVLHRLGMYVPELLCACTCNANKNLPNDKAVLLRVDIQQAAPSYVRSTSTMTSHADGSACNMVQLEEAEDWEDQVDEIMEGFAKDTGMKPLYTICFA